MIDDPNLPPAGVTSVDGSSVDWCVWAPKAKAVSLLHGLGEDTESIAMIRDERGYHSCRTATPKIGQRYAYSLDGGPPLPDPCSRWQPDGVLRPSAYWAPPARREVNLPSWRGVERDDLVFYELHVGTFTPEGTFDAIIPRIGSLLELGITAIELMPVGQFPGTRGWGYDVVHPFAVQHSYGGPDGLLRLVDACHSRGMAIFLDVIYNHLGPEGNVFPQFGEYFTEKYKTDWGAALNYDGRGSDSVRAMVLENARQWIRDFHIDGLRLDATDQIYDRSPHHILQEVAEVVHRESERLGQKAYVFAETDMNDARRFLNSRDRGGYALDGQWNDDFHHAVHVALTGETSGYYLDFEEGPAAIAKAINRGFVNDGSYSRFRGRRHGTPAREFEGARFVAFTQNHDQVGNRLEADRNAVSLPPSALRLAAGILLLSPRLPLLFMGEEYGETNPFPYFCEVEDPQLRQAIREGRKAEFASFGWESDFVDPIATTTRDQAILSWDWENPNRAGLRLLYQELLRLRRQLPALRDYTNFSAQMLQDSVLELIRGESVNQLRIIYNFSETRRSLTELDENSTPAFRSELVSYGGAIKPSDTWNQVLMPHEFVIFQRW